MFNKMFAIFTLMFATPTYAGLDVWFEGAQVENAGRNWIGQVRATVVLEQANNWTDNCSEALNADGSIEVYFSTNSDGVEGQVLGVLLSAHSQNKTVKLLNHAAVPECHSKGGVRIYGVQIE